MVAAISDAAFCAAFAFFSLRFSLMDLPDFLEADCRGDLSAMIGSSAAALKLPSQEQELLLGPKLLRLITDHTARLLIPTGRAPRIRQDNGGRTLNHDHLLCARCLQHQRAPRAEIRDMPAVSDATGFRHRNRNIKLRSR